MFSGYGDRLLHTLIKTFVDPEARRILTHALDDLEVPRSLTAGYERPDMDTIVEEYTSRFRR